MQAFSEHRRILMVLWERMYYNSPIYRNRQMPGVRSGTKLVLLKCRDFILCKKGKRKGGKYL